MNIRRDRDDQQEALLRAIVEQMDRTSDAPATPHLDDETLALFALGGLAGEQRESTIAHLADCELCRQTASHLASHDEPALAKAIPFPAPRKRSRLFLYVPLAASILCLIGVFVLFSNRNASQMLTEQQTYEEASQLLDAGDVQAATRLIRVANERGTTSDRLRGLFAEGVREIPASIALASVGRLSDFGYGIGGIVARDPAAAIVGTGHAAALDVLGTGKSHDRTLLLNRGHTLLAFGETERALADFETALEVDNADPLAWLGKGLAEYMLERFKEAERSFKRALELDSASTPARINLAMTLEENSNLTEALELWKTLLSKQLSAEERRQIEQHIRELESAVQ